MGYIHKRDQVQVKPKTGSSLQVFIQNLSLIPFVNTVEPQLSEPHGRHTIRPDNRGVRIDEGNRNSRSMGYRVGDN